jgi:hypothetical protein
MKITTRIRCTENKQRVLDYRLFVAFDLPAHYLNTFIETANSPLVSLQRVQSFSSILCEETQCSADNTSRVCETMNSAESAFHVHCETGNISVVKHMVLSGI